MDEIWPWHRLFGLAWMDFFQGTPVTVEMEKDLSVKLQLLDVVLLDVEQTAMGRRLPDGFEELGRYNLLSFKSLQEALDGWALDELIGHFVNLRKQISPTMQRLLPLTDFRLFAVSARYPQGLAQQVPLQPVGQGVYQVCGFSRNIRLVVISQLPLQPHNAMLHLFSANEEYRRYGAEHYRPSSPETSRLLYQLFRKYRLEGLPMPFTLEDVRRQTIKDVLEEATPEQRLEGLSPEKLLQGLSAEQRQALVQLLKADEPPKQE